MDSQASFSNTGSALAATSGASSQNTDVQTVAIKQGLRPTNDREHWGYESEERWGTLVTDEGSKVIPSAQGDYTRFYDAFALAVENGGAGPVPAVAAEPRTETIMIST